MLSPETSEPQTTAPAEQNEQPAPAPESPVSDVVSPPPSPLVELPVVLRATNISKSFRSAQTANPQQNRLQVLQNITLEIHEGELISICGASGSGKTTLLQILGGLESPDSGELFWNDQKISNRSNTYLARKRSLWLGYVFQSYHLIPELTALENVLLAARIAKISSREATARAHQLLEHVGLSQRLHHHPAKLSGGECQRVAIARALINNPRLILADEPTGNLDETTGEKIMELLLNLTTAHRVALVLVTHNPAFALRAPRRLLLSHGTLSAL